MDEKADDRQINSFFGRDSQQFADLRYCRCHKRPVFMCPDYKSRLGNYLYLRKMEIMSLSMGKNGGLFA